MSVPFYVMPYYETSLRKLLAQGVPHDKALMYFSQLLDGVEAAHLEGIVHRDIKPENILLDASNDLLLLADFGIARFEEEELFTAVETADRDRLANFQYAAPEQRTRGGTVGHAADIYALGLILNEMFTGQIPLGTDYVTIADVAPEYEYLDATVRAMLRQKPENRPQSIELLKEQLIAKKTEFVTRQRLSELKQTVVPVTDLDDPLIIDPPRLIGADYRNKELFLKLSRAVNTRWIYQLQNLRVYHTHLSGKPPQAFEIRDNIARIDATEDEVQRIVDCFKEWLPLVTQQYEQAVQGENASAERKKRMEIQRERDEAETRLRVLRNLKI